MSQYATLVVSAGLFFSYILTLPWSGPVYDLDAETNFRIPLPTLNETCQVKSQPNTSLQLAYVDCGVAFLLSAFLTVYMLSPKKGTKWPLEILWATGLLIFLIEMIVFGVLVARISVFFLSCTNAAKREGACPATRFEQLRGDITDTEQCYFSADTLTVFNAENDAFTSCQDGSALEGYQRRFARWDVPAYYSTSALCAREESSTNLAFCHYWGCHAICNADTYVLNLKWFVLDICLLFTILASHLLTFGNFYILKGGTVKQE